MIKWSRLLIVAVLNLTAGAAASAQTVMVRRAPAGEAVEVVLNAAKVGSGTTDASGEVSLPLDLSSIGKTEIDANVFVDACDSLHRVIVVERAKLPDPQQPGCARRDVAGLYWVRSVNTIVVDVGGAVPTLLLVKGKFKVDTPHTWLPSPSGLVVFGGGAFVNVRDAVLISCGSVTSCSGHNSGLGYTVGLTYWFKPFLGVEAAYVRPRKITASGSGDTYNFNSSLDPNIGTIVGKGGVPIGPARLYGHAGWNYHEATSSTTETINGASQTLSFKTKGWSWIAGGGLEVWFSRNFALYTDVNFASMKGDDEAGSEARIDDAVRFLAFGARFRIGK